MYASTAQRKGLGFDWDVFSDVFKAGAGAAGSILPSVLGGSNISNLPYYTAQGGYSAAPRQADAGFSMGDITPWLIGGGVILAVILFTKK